LQPAEEYEIATRPIVLVIGDLVADVTIAPGEAPVHGEEIEGVISLQGGGSAANQTAWLAHLGAQVRFVGRVGDDLLGALLSDQLRASGVHCRIVVDRHRSTGIVAAMLDEEGERALVTHRAANAHLRADDISPELWDGVQLLVLTGYLFTHPPAAEAGRALMALARERDIPVALDPASHRLIVRYPGARRFLDWTAGAAWFFPNSSEALHLTGATSEGAAAAMLLELYEGVAITRGASGCLIATKDEGRMKIAEIPSQRRVAPIDSTGAGDAFAAGFLFAWLRGDPPHEAAASGLRLAERAVQQVGARPRPL
jgi:sugar/nucleoside kinase (ribokinase family)